MTSLEKLKIILPHWEEHNKEHAVELRDWAKELLEEDVDVSGILEKVANLFDESTKLLRAASVKVGRVSIDHSVHHHH